MKRRILVVRTDRVGDVVMITPVIRELRRKYPDSFIATLTNPNSADVLINNPHLNEAITDDMSRKSFYNVVSKLRQLRFTDGLLVMPTERAAYQMFLGGVKNRIGVGRKLFEVITMMKSVSRNKYIPLRHEADYCMDLARAVGAEPESLIPEIFVTEDERERGASLLRESGSDPGKQKIFVHTGSGGSSRNWSEGKYIQLIMEIIRLHPDKEIILTAKEMSDEFMSSSVKSGGGRVIDVSGRSKRLRDLIQMISCAQLLIAGSTGPLHIASALGKKTIGLYCHRNMNCAKHWGALGPAAVNLEVSKDFCDANCSGDKEICNFEEGISIQSVLDSI
ncbi:MAG: glycosyltransferase family 9 protein [Ignavibacteria bacterium]|nr:glycosyltransferase family 9 protein [Ignavibacteria bacterium]